MALNIPSNAVMEKALQNQAFLAGFVPYPVNVLNHGRQEIVFEAPVHKSAGTPAFVAERLGNPLPGGFEELLLGLGELGRSFYQATAQKTFGGITFKYFDGMGGGDLYLSDKGQAVNVTHLEPLRIITQVEVIRYGLRVYGDDDSWCDRLSEVFSILPVYGSSAPHQRTPLIACDLKRSLVLCSDEKLQKVGERFDRSSRADLALAIGLSIIQSIPKSWRSVPFEEDISFDQETAKGRFHYSVKGTGGNHDISIESGDIKSDDRRLRAEWTVSGTKLPKPLLDLWDLAVDRP